MRRREFMSFVGGAAFTFSSAARAQQAGMPVVGFINSSLRDRSAYLVTGFQQGLNETGYVDGQNVLIEHRWAEGQYDRMPSLARDLVDKHVDVIMAGGPPAALTAKAATSAIPIVFTTGDDPIKAGLVESFNKPGGNVTGIYILASELGPKRLELLHEVLPTARNIAFLINPTNKGMQIQLQEMQGAAASLDLGLQVLRANSEGDIDAAFGTLVQQQIGALILAGDPVLNSRRNQIMALSARHAIATVYEVREGPISGGLMSYGTNITDVYRQAGNYVGRILKGAKAADLPVQQVTKVELVVNLKAAKALGLTFPVTLLGRADEVIE
jgi:putative tryptophan/tyrosine transport system substrate-binding protein